MIPISIVSIIYIRNSKTGVILVTLVLILAICSTVFSSVILWNTYLERKIIPTPFRAGGIRN